LQTPVCPSAGAALRRAEALKKPDRLGEAEEGFRAAVSRFNRVQPAQSELASRAHRGLESCVRSRADLP
jgi:hypothetical protein